MIFSASFGITAKISTALVILILSGIAAADYATGGKAQWPLLTLFALGILVLICYAFSVKYYEVTDDALIIHKPFGETIIARSSIKSAEEIDRKALRFAIRTFGIGGIFGFYGEFYTSKLGTMTWYRTRLDRPVLITTVKKKIVLSPDDPEKFIAALQS
jgi:hypothetical protein